VNLLEVACVPEKIRFLHELADVAIDSPATKQTLTRVADLVRKALGASQVFLVYSEDRQFLACGDSRAKDGLTVNQMGLWLVQHQVEILGGPVAFDVNGERVSDIVGAHDAASRDYLGFQIGADSDAEMLIIKKPSKAPADLSLFAFVEAAAPAIALVMDRVLSVARANRQREQMMAIANAAELLIQAEHTTPVLRELANAISNSTGYDLVTIDVYDKELEAFSVSALNRGPQIETSLGQTWTQNQNANELYPEAILKAAMALRTPLLLADLQTDERIPESGREFFKRAHIFSSAQFPIAFHDEFLGVLRVASQRPRSFPESEVEILNGLATQLAAALKALQMYRSLAQSERQLKEYAEELQSSMEVQHRLARTDALTGVPNRRYIDEMIKGECSRAVRHKTLLCVAIADVDRFKAINDNYGHKAGDAALMQLGDLARRSCRQGDMVGRYGGDEFLFVLPRADLTAAVRFANRFRSSVANHVFSLSPETSVRMSISVGVAELNPEEAQKPLALVKEADQGLYQAKAKGGNKTCSVHPRKRAA
jgi:diguanylate cyclase (GGDEF)-like protein